MNYKITFLFFSILIYGCDSKKTQAERKFKEGQEMFNASKLDSSILLFQEAISLDESNSKAKYYLSETYRQNSNFEAAITTLNSIEDKSIPLDSIYSLYSSIYAGKEDHDSTILYAKKAIQINPNSAESHLELGKAYYNKANSLSDNEKIDYFKLALNQVLISNEIKPNNNECLLMRGIIRFGFEDYKGALKDFNLIIKTNKADRYTLYQTARFTGLCYYEQKRFSDALKILDIAISLGENIGIVRINRAIVKHELKMYDESCEDFRKALELGENAAVDYIKEYCNGE